ncbi:MAG: hypothetical protein ACF8R7_03410 [Phycisphaerales bacterium JB039]
MTRFALLAAMNDHHPLRAFLPPDIGCGTAGLSALSAGARG